MSRRLLLVSYCFPPILTAEAILITRTVRALDDLGWQVTALTVDEADAEGMRDPLLSGRLPASTQVRTAPSYEPTLRALRRIPLRVLLQAGMPEEQLPWRFAARGAGVELLRNGRFDAMLSWASYHTSNVVGLDLRRLTGIPWVAHFSDPWVRSPYFPRRPLQRVAAARLERAIFREADVLTFTTRETVDLVMRGESADVRGKAVVIPHGFEETAALAPRAVGGPLRIVHSGQFYKGRRTPLTLITAIARLHRQRSLEGRLHVLFVGPSLPEYAAAAQRAGLANVVEFAGPRSSGEAQRLASEADVLLVIDAPSSGPSVFLPSKVVDYLALRRPILGLTPEIGATAELLGRAGCPTVAPDDVPGIEAVIDLLLAEYETSGRAAPEPPPALLGVLAEYEIHTTTGALATVLERLSAPR